MPGVPDVAGTEVNQHPDKPHALMKPHPPHNTDAHRVHKTFHHANLHFHLCTLAHIHIHFNSTFTTFTTYIFISTPHSPHSTCTHSILCTHTWHIHMVHLPSHTWHIHMVHTNAFYVHLEHTHLVHLAHTNAFLTLCIFIWN
jgi:hypothetical protein